MNVTRAFRGTLGRFLVTSIVMIGFGITALAQNAFAYFESPITNAGSGSGWCMSSLGTHSNGAPAVLWACNNSANQYWINAPASGGGSILQNVGDEWCMTNYQGLSVNYNWQTLWPCDNTGGSSNYKQSYVVLGSAVSGPDGCNPKSLASTCYIIETVNSSDHVTGYCLTSNGARFNGAHVEEFACNNTQPNQAWKGGTLTPP